LRSPFSIEELKRLIRRIEFDKTDYELLCDLIERAEELGTVERKRLERLSKTSSKLSDIFLNKRLILPLNIDPGDIKEAASCSAWGVDGSCQVLKGFGDSWFVFLSAARVHMCQGLYGDVIIRVGGEIKRIEVPEDREAGRIATELMMHMEVKQIQNVAREATQYASGKAHLVIDGPIIDPPWLADEDYVAKRVKAIEKCLAGGITVVGFVKRPYGHAFLSQLRESEELKDGLGELIKSYRSDVSLLAPLMYAAMKKTKSELIITIPLEMPASVGTFIPAHETYEKHGLKVYYCYYKFGLRRNVYRLEIAEAETRRISDESELIEIFRNTAITMAGLTPPGIEYPLPVLLAHDKCNIRRGAAETLYYDIIARALAQGMTALWF